MRHLQFCKQLKINKSQPHVKSCLWFELINSRLCQTVGWTAFRTSQCRLFLLQLSNHHTFRQLVNHKCANSRRVSFCPGLLSQDFEHPKTANIGVGKQAEVSKCEIKAPLVRVPLLLVSHRMTSKADSGDKTPCHNSQ